MSVIAISTGEPSGDMYGAALARSLYHKRPGLQIVGCGATRMRSAGVTILEDSADWGAVSVVEALRVAPRAIGAFARLRRRILAAGCQLLIAIDFGAFNVSLCRWARGAGIATLYFMPPGAWRRTEQGRDLPSVCSAIATPFEWSDIMLRQMGAHSQWVGHPLLDLVRPEYSSAAFRRLHGLGDNGPILGLLPGSRRHEVRHLLPTMARTADLLRHRVPNLHVIGGLAPNLDRELVERASVRSTLPPITWISGQTYDVLAHSTALAVCSGTATLEAAILGTPMVTVYRGSWLMNVEYRLRRPAFDHISLPNILMPERVVPEFIQEQATPERLADELISLLEETPARCQQKQRLLDVRAGLGSPGSVDRTADLALSLITPS